MPGEPGDLREVVKGLASRTLDDTLANLRRNSEVRRLVARGELTENELAEAYRDYAQHVGPEYARTVADATVRYYAELAELATEYSSRFYDSVMVPFRQQPASQRFAWEMNRSNGRDQRDRPDQYNQYDQHGDMGNGSGAAAQTALSVRRVPLEVHAPSGRVASGSFVLSNQNDQPTDVSFDVSMWRGSDGRVFETPVVMNPPSARLQPGGRVDVTVSVRLKPELFFVDHLYTATVAIRGYGAMELVVTAWVEQADETPTSTSTRHDGDDGAAAKPLEAKAAVGSPTKSTLRKKAVKVATTKRATPPRSARPRDQSAGPGSKTGQ